MTTGPLISINRYFLEADSLFALIFKSTVKSEASLIVNKKKVASLLLLQFVLFHRHRAWAKNY